jgi:Zn-finger nucleic acid-binding protein
MCSIQSYEGVQIDSCSSCQGIWLDQGELQTIAATEEVAFSRSSIDEAIRNAKPGQDSSSASDPVACPVCTKPARAINYQYQSGVIINVCVDHGFWLDSGELQRIEMVVEQWKKEKNRHGVEWSTNLAAGVRQGESEIQEIQQGVDRALDSVSLLFRVFHRLTRDK